MTVLHPFEVEVSKVISEKNQVEVFWRLQSKITKQRCIVSSTSFLNITYYINKHNIAFFYLY